MIKIKYTEANLDRVPASKVARPVIYRDIRYPNLYFHSGMAEKNLSLQVPASWTS
jgi:hypothetical protein